MQFCNSSENALCNQCHNNECSYNILSYSEKAKGMAEYVYGTSHGVFSLIEFEDYHKIANIIREWNLESRIDSIKEFDFKSLFVNV